LAAISSDGSTLITRASDTNESDGQPDDLRFVGFVYDHSGQTLTFYYNGSADNGTLTGTVPNSLNMVWDPVRIGASISGNYWAGEGDEVIIGNTALSASDVLALYNQAA
jgi:hypothetical protein